MATPGGKGTTRSSLRLASVTTAIGLAAATVVSAHAQGVLTVTPGRTSTVAAGTGTLGYSGDNGAATSATLAAPTAVAYDSNGNLYIADTNNHAVRRVTAAGTVTTVAGTGIAGFAGDGAAATAALLDTPTGIAVDAAGNIYIADSHNNRIRKVTGTTITTVAGTGAAAFTGDGAAATAASLSLPTGVAVDAAGSIYIADTNNHRIRKVTGTTIATVAGTGEQGFTGDGAAATAAALDAPTAVAVDSAGIVYIADRHNQRVRTVSAGGTITTLAGSGTPNFAGGFSGDNGSAAAATLARPSGIAVDALGNVYIADTDNHRVRQAGNGGITTLVGTGEQALTPTTLNTPRGVAANAGGSVLTADTLNQRVLAGTQPTLTFTPAGVGTASTPQTVTLGNSGNAPLTLNQVATTSNYTRTPGGTCTATPITLAPGATCTVTVTYTQAATGSTTGTLSIGGTNIPSQTVLLASAAVATRTATVTTLTSSQAAPIAGQSITYTATVASQNGVGVPTGSVVFTANGITIGTANLTNGTATFTTSFPAAGTQTIVATYSGDTLYAPSTAGYPQIVVSFLFAIGSGGSNGSFRLTVAPGGTGVFSFTVTPFNGPFPYPVTFSATGAPTGSVITFTPPTVTLSNGPANVTMTVQVPAVLSAVRWTGGTTAALGLLLLPFARRLRGRAKRHARLLLAACLSVVTLGGLAGCGSGNGFFSQPVKSYTILVTATAALPNGQTQTQTAPVTLVVQ